MFKKSIKILTIQKEGMHSNVLNFIIENLESINYNVLLANVEVNEKHVIEEVNASMKQCDIVLFIGALGVPYSQIIWNAVAKVFHQELIESKCLFQHSKNMDKYITKYAKCFHFQNNGTLPIMYIQGLFLLADDYNLIQSSVIDIVIPYLKQFNREMLFHKQITIAGSDDLLHSLNSLSSNEVSVSCDVSNYFKLSLTSTKMSALLDFEKQLAQKYTIIDNYECTDIMGLVYNQQDIHIKTSVECVEECFKKYRPENVFLSFNGGKDCTVLLHLTMAVLRKNYPDYKEKLCCLYIENKNPFPELNKFIEEARQYYNLDIIKFTKSIKDSLSDILITKPNMKAVLMGTRRSDPFSEHLTPFHMTDLNWPQVIRVSPILDWHYSQIWDYLLFLNVPYCSLYDAGYTSLGSSTNTIRNQYLLVNEDDDKKEYLPAYKLLDGSKERSGRMQS